MGDLPVSHGAGPCPSEFVRVKRHKSTLTTAHVLFEWMDLISFL